jgi:hypothetical protein
VTHQEIIIDVKDGLNASKIWGIKGFIKKS